MRKKERSLGSLLGELDGMGIHIPSLCEDPDCQCHDESVAAVLGILFERGEVRIPLDNENLVFLRDGFGTAIMAASEPN